MTRQCDVQPTGAIELYFYDELGAAERERFEQHLSACAACRSALDELRLIRTALARRPDVSAPPAGDWSGFMSRLSNSVGRYSVDRYSKGPADRSTDLPIHRPPALRTYRPYLAMAALLALVTMSVVSVVRWRTASPGEPAIAQDGRPSQSEPQAATLAAASPTAALAAISEQHFERSKLVLLGLTAKDADAVSPEEWTYERELATSLLSDTRLYRMAAEDRGMDALAGVLRDLELVLLQTSFTESDPEALGQLQRLIRKRNVLEKIEVVTTSGI